VGVYQVVSSALHFWLFACVVCFVWRFHYLRYSFVPIVFQLCAHFPVFLLAVGFGILVLSSLPMLELLDLHFARMSHLPV